jgi:hypothetical protein
MNSPATHTSSISYANPTPAAKMHTLMNRAGLDAITVAAELEIDWLQVVGWTGGSGRPPRWAFLALEALGDRQRHVD